MRRCGLLRVKALKVCLCSCWKVADGVHIGSAGKTSWLEMWRDGAVKCKLYVWRKSESWKRITQIIKPFQHIKKKWCVPPLAGAGLAAPLYHPTFETSRLSTALPHLTSNVSQSQLAGLTGARQFWTFWLFHKESNDVRTFWTGCITPLWGLRAPKNLGWSLARRP